MRSISCFVALVLMLGACASPGFDPNEEPSTGAIPDAKEDRGSVSRPQTPTQRLNRLVTLLKGGATSLDLPDRARSAELPFEDAVHVEVSVVAAPDGVHPIVTPAVARLTEEFSNDPNATLLTLEENGTRYAMGNFGARDYFLKTLIDRRVRAEVTDLVGDADEVFRLGIYDDQSELTGTEFVVLYFGYLKKAIVFEMGYSEVY